MTETFARLRPLCVQFAKSPSLGNIEPLREEVRLLQKGDAEFPHPLLEYALFPLLLHLKSEKVPESVILAILDCLSILFRTCPVAKQSLLEDIITTIYSLHMDKEAKEFSEEVKLSSVICVDNLLRFCSLETRQCLYTIHLMPSLGFAVSITLKFIEKEKLKRLKLKAVECLLTLCWLDESEDLERRSHVLASFLPGITSTLAKVILSDNIQQSHEITSNSLGAFSAFVSVVFNNSLMSQRDNVKEGSEANLLVTRDSDWWKRSANKLDTVLQKICSLRLWTHWKVRLALCQFSSQLLNNCHQSLEESVPCLAECLMVHLCDDYEAVATCAKSALATFSSQLEDERLSLLALLEKNIFALFTSFPSLIKSSDSSKRLGTLSLLLGYFEMLGSRVSTFLSSVHHLRRLSQAILQVLELEMNSRKIWELEVSIINEPKLESQVPAANELYSLLHFKHFSDQETLQLLVKICRRLGQYGDTSLLLDHFLEIFCTSETLRLQAALAINEILRGSSDANSVHTSTVLSTYLSSEYWDEGLRADSRDSLLFCLLIDGVAACSEAIGKDFDDYLYVSLCPIVEKLGSLREIVRETAYRALCVIAIRCGYVSVRDLIGKNVSYMIDAAFSGLRHLTETSVSPRILRVLLQYSDSTILSILDDTLDEIFRALENGFGSRIGLLLPVISSLVEAVRRWFPQPERSDNEKAKSNLSLCDFYAELEREFAEEKMPKEEERSIDEDQVKAPLPEHQCLTLKILNACVKFVGVPDSIRLSSQVLSVIENGLYVVTSATDEVLPFIHTLLSPLTNLLAHDDDDLTSIAVFGLVRAIVTVSGDFFSRRLIERVWPAIRAILRGSDKNSLVGRRRINLETAALSTLDLMARKLRIAEKDLLGISVALLDYLTHSRSREVIEAAIRVVEGLTLANGDLAWLVFSGKQALKSIAPDFLRFTCTGAEK